MTEKLMNTAEKFEKIFSSGWFVFENTPTDYSSDKIRWTHVIFPVTKQAKTCEIGFDNIDDCLDDCLKYIETLKK
jgi:hypothetical protein